MRSKPRTIEFYQNGLNFKIIADYDDYLILEKDQIEIHFFAFSTLNPKTNYGQVYIRTETINTFYESLIADNIPIHPNGKLKNQPWGQREFSILDPDHNLLTFGQAI